MILLTAVINCIINQPFVQSADAILSIFPLSVIKSLKCAMCGFHTQT